MLIACVASFLLSAWAPSPLQVGAVESPAGRFSRYPHALSALLRHPLAHLLALTLRRLLESRSNEK